MRPNRVVIRLASPLVTVAALTAVGCAEGTAPVERSASASPSAASIAKPSRTAASARLTSAREAAWAPPSPLPPELTAPLTVERVAAASSMLVRPEPEPKVYPLLLAQLGKPTRTLTGTHALVGRSQKRFQWAARSGTTCAAYFVVEQPNTLEGWPSHLAQDVGGGTFPMPKTLPTNTAEGAAVRDAWERYAACVAVLGESPGLPANGPGAAGPGALVTKADLTTGLERAPSLWLGKVVAVEGVLRAGGATVPIETAKGSVACRFREGSAPPWDDGKKHRVRGTVLDLRVEDHWGVDLDACELVR